MIVRCGLSGACVILVCSVHMDNKVCMVCTNIIMARVVCAVLVERRGVWLVRVQYEYMLSRNSLVNGARKLLVCGGGVLKFIMVQRIE
jgi:hypothetical protein